ncbi:MAG: hypothetical protein V9H69_22750 [Anaerolineae bacterium]
MIVVFGDGVQVSEIQVVRRHELAQQPAIPPIQSRHSALSRICYIERDAVGAGRHRNRLAWRGLQAGYQAVLIG